MVFYFEPEGNRAELISIKLEVESGRNHVKLMQSVSGYYLQLETVVYRVRKNF